MSVELVARFVKRFSTRVEVEADLRQRADAFSVTVLFGVSGCGKTTTLRCLAGLERPEQGRITFGSATWFDAEQRVWLAPQQRDIGFLFQDYALFPHLTVARNIAYGLGRLGRAEVTRRVAGILGLFGLSGLQDRYPHEVSGGQQQRIALARVLVRRPRLLLLDEPLSAVDTPTREQLRPELRRLLAGFGIPVVLVTHDRTEATALADHLIVMDQGKVCQQGPAADVFNRPASLAVARVIGMETIEAGKVVSIENGIAKVSVGRALLVAPALGPMPDQVLVCIRGEDVLVRPEGAGPGTSNRLDGLVLSLTPEGPLVRVVLDCGFRMGALVSRQSCAELGLHEGGRITAFIRASAVHLIAQQADDAGLNRHQHTQPETRLSPCDQGLRQG
jgi:molybdate transport system ATP-binding protein